MKALLLTREYPPQIYGGAGVVVDELTRALSRRMPVEVRCFGERRPDASSGRVTVRGYTPWERLAAGNDGARYAPALETLSIDLAMARDPGTRTSRTRTRGTPTWRDCGSARSIASRSS